MHREQVAFVGLGVMGFPMAGHLAEAGHAVTVFNRTRARAEDWARRHAGEVADSPAMAARSARVVCLCVGNDADVREVALGASGVLESLAPGGLLIDHTTASPELARDLAKAAAAREIGFVDAPVSGGQAGAEQGQLTVMAGGTAHDYARAAAVMECYGRSLRHMGAAGSGQLTKMVNQICIAGVLQGLSEGMDFAQRLGLDPEAVVDAISEGAAGSWQMHNRAATMARGEFDFGFAVQWMRKDLGMVLQTGRAAGARLPLTALVDQFYADVEAMGGARWDTSSLIQRLRDPAQRSDTGT